MKEIMAILIGGLLYSAAFGGYVLMFCEEIRCFGRKLMMRGRLAAAKKRYREEGRFRRHLNKILLTAFNDRVNSAHFLWFCGLLFLGVCLAAARSMTAAQAIATAVAAALLPYIVLRLKLEVIRKKSSYEGEAFIGNFLSAYRMSNNNIFEAMEKTGRERRQTRNCSEFMVKILLEVRNTANHEDISRATEKFAFAINTNWSRMLAYNIALAISSGTNISLALEDILIQLREAKTVCEERKRINSEAARIVKFFIPALYLASVFLSVKFVGISPERYIHNQFFTAQGFMTLAAALFLFALNLILIELVTNRQFDY